MQENTLYNYTQPAFYNDFCCIGGNCPYSCCYLWNIGYANEEVERIQKADCSELLHSLAETSFVPWKEDFSKIKLINNKYCPFLTEEKLCRIQKELGEKYLSFACRVYPRYERIFDNGIMRTIRCSCVHTEEIIMNQKDSMKLENVCDTIKASDHHKFYKDKDYKKYPYLTYQRALFDFFYEILSDEMQSIETSIILGALAAQKLDEFIKKGQIERIPKILQTLKPQLNNPAQIEKLERVKPNISLKANFINELKKKMHYHFQKVDIFENYELKEQNIEDIIKKFNDTFADRPYAIRNLALNIYITQRMPFWEKENLLFDNYCFFVSEIAMIKYLGAIVAAQYEEVDKKFYVIVSDIDRTFAHDKKNFSLVMDVIKDFGITSPAYLLGILK